ncbi:MutS-related protein [Chitinophagaceae bacterium MMS25-I14]
MPVSEQTLYDLNIFSRNPAEQTVFRLLDRCKTEGARKVLQETCRMSFSREKIVARQAAIGYIAMHMDDWQFPLRENEIYYTEEYLRSSYSTIRSRNYLKRGAVSLIRFFTQKPQYFFLLGGIKQLMLVTGAIRDLYLRAYKQEMPGMLKEYFRELKEHLDALHYDSGITDIFLNEEPSPAQIFRTDQNLWSPACRGHIQALFAVYYQLEALCSLAVVHKERKLVFPDIADTGDKLFIKDLSHPLIKNCRPNTVQLKTGSNLLLITGPNMAGKSSYIKSIGVACFMAGIGMGIAASEAAMPLFEQLLTSITIQDNIGEGYSYFFNEVRQVKGIAAILNNKTPALVIADELFKGTNVHDTFDCSEIVLNGFMNHPESIFIVATHLTELAQKLRGDERCN